jgi:hypothetical protein
LVTLLTQELGNAPHGLRLGGPVASFEPWLLRGQDAIIEPSALRVPGSGITIDLSGATVWHGAVAGVSLVPSSPAVLARLREVHATLCECAPDQGLAPLLTTRGIDGSPVERAMARRLSRALPMLASATERGDVTAFAGAAAQLVGLGPGLTPSGDDFIAGYLAALWSRAGREAGLRAMLRLLADALAPVFLCTNAISRQMLGDAAQGHFPERLVAVTVAIAGDEEVAEATRRALESGHSSGADSLCGLLFGYAPETAVRALLMLAGEPAPRQSAARADQFQSDSGRLAAITC